MNRTYAAVLSLTTLASVPAHANMTIAAQAAGGLTPIHYQNITIDEEDLYISPKLVRVRYVFRNLTGKDVDTPILFPLPDLDTHLQSNDSYVIPVPYGAEPPIIPARVKVNGEQVHVGWQQHAHTIDGRDVTKRLTAAKIPLIAVGDVTEAVRRLPEEQRQAFVDDGILEPGHYNDYSATWIVRGAYYWRQRFPAKGPTVVELEYEPLTGGYMTTLNMTATEKPADVEKSLGQKGVKREYVPWQEEYCVTKKHVQAMAQFPRKTDEPDASINWTRYVLVTARNWQAPIGRFRLVVDKLQSDAVAAFCSPDRKAPIRQTSPTTYEVVIKDFYPDTNFQLLTVKPE